MFAAETPSSKVERNWREMAAEFISQGICNTVMKYYDMG
jgi:hypothetical protein